MNYAYEDNKIKDLIVTTNTHNSDLNSVKKRVWKIGSILIVVIEDNLAKKIGIKENCIVEESISSNGDLVIKIT
ncbi:MAG: hypothetical protein ACPKPY_02870 [Nitrososphaeraceae archaeon]